jgi:UDP-N-acetylmuramoyl-L-alanyl-D-glutamate--2,6-diaminopimelate ligase
VSAYPRPSSVVGVPLRDLARTAHARPAENAGEATADSDRLVTGITHDSTAVRPGDLYVAMPGARRHGAEFAGQAAAAGAVAILTDTAGADIARAAHPVPVLIADHPRAVLGPVAAHTYGDPTAQLPVIGITGTAGKTSVAYLVESGLAAAGRVTCMIGTVETRIAGETIDSVRTTPEATDLQALFAVALERGATAAVMEVSSHALALDRVGGVHFAVGGFTNFGLDHLDFHTDADDYFGAKARLFDGRCRVEILNSDDPPVRSLLRPGRLSFSAAGDPTATWRAEGITADGFGQRFTAVGPAGRLPTHVALPGRHNVSNALLAIASLVAIGIDPVVATAGVGACRGVPGRLELVGAPGPVLGVVDYAHKPDAIIAALAALRDVAGQDGGSGRLICVIGAGGDRDRGKRPFMGEAAARGADIVLVTDDNPRSEDPAAIRGEVLVGATGALAAHVIEVAGRREAIAEAVALAKPGDVVAVLGKGHERGQEVAGVISPFDDRLELAAALAAANRDAGTNGAGTHSAGTYSAGTYSAGVHT